VVKRIALPRAQLDGPRLLRAHIGAVRRLDRWRNADYREVSQKPELADLEALFSAETLLECGTCLWLAGVWPRGHRMSL
jgi:hypothetical protein